MLFVIDPDALTGGKMIVGVVVPPTYGAEEAPATARFKVPSWRIERTEPAAGDAASAPALPSRRTPSLTVVLPVKVFAPERISKPLPAFVRLPVPLTRLAEIVSAFAGVAPAVVITSSLLVAEVVIPKLPEMVAAPPVLSCRMPPNAVALAEVIVSVPPSTTLPPARRKVFAATPPVVVIVEVAT